MKKVSGYVSVKPNKKAYLLCLAPVLLTGLYILALSIDGTYQVGEFYLFSPISMFSLFSLVVLLAAIFLWGFIGYVCAKARLTLVKSLLVCHAFPLLMTVVYLILNVIVIETQNETIQEIAYLIGGVSCNFISIVGTFVYNLIPINIVEPIINLFVMAFAFIGGYVISTSTTKKNKETN